MNKFSHYKIGSLIGQLLSITEFVHITNENEQKVKLNFADVYGKLNELLEELKKIESNPKTIEEITNVLGSYTTNYGDPLSNVGTEKSGKLIGGFKARYKMGKINRKTLKKEDIEELINSLRFWNDRLEIALKDDAKG